MKGFNLDRAKSISSYFPVFLSRISSPDKVALHLIVKRGDYVAYASTIESEYSAKRSTLSPWKGRRILSTQSSWIWY